MVDVLVSVIEIRDWIPEALSYIKKCESSEKYIIKLYSMYHLIILHATCYLNQDQSIRVQTDEVFYWK